MSSEFVDNAYYDRVLKQFVKAQQKKAEMEEKFYPSMTDDYNSLKKDIITLSADLIKFGASYDEDEECINILVDDEIYDIPKNEIRNILGDRQYHLIFDKESREEVSQNGRDYSKSSSDVNQSENDYGNTYAGNQMQPYPFNPMAMMMMNPFAAMFQYMYPFMNAYGNGFVPAVSPSAKDKEPEDGLSDILHRISDIQNKVLILEKEKTGAKDSATQLRQKYDTLKQNLENLEQKYEEEKNLHEQKSNELSERNSEFEKQQNDFQIAQEAFESQKKELEEKLEAIDEALKQKDLDIMNINNSKNELEQQTKKLAAELQEACNARNNALSENGSLKKNLEEVKKEKDAQKAEEERLRSQLSNIKAELDKANRRNTDLTNIYNDLKNKAKAKENASEQFSTELTKKKDELQKKEEEVLSLRKRAEAAEAQINSMKEQTEEALEKAQKAEQMSNQYIRNAQMKEKEYTENIEKLTKLAYEDGITGVGNGNAFNRDFISVAKGSIILAEVDICGMKKINDRYGKHSGDNAIKAVASALKESFPNCSIYRVMGDQFLVLTVNNTLNSVSGQLADLYHNLLGQDIRIAYGTAIGNNCENHASIIETAHRMAEEMKKQPIRTESQNQFYNTMQQNNIQANNAAMTTTEQPEEIDLNEAIMEYMNG